MSSSSFLFTFKLNLSSLQAFGRIAKQIFLLFGLTEKMVMVFFSWFGLAVVLGWTGRSFLLLVFCLHFTFCTVQKYCFGLLLVKMVTIFVFLFRQHKTTSGVVTEEIVFLFPVVIVMM